MTNQPQQPEYVPNILFPEVEVLPENPAYQIIQSDIRNAINAGLNQQQTLDTYRNAGLQFTDSTVRRMYNDAKAEIAAGQNYLSLPLDEMIGDTSRDVMSWEGKARYLDEIQLTVYDINRDEIKQIMFRLYHDDPMSIQEAIDSAMATFNEVPSGQQYLSALAGSLARSAISSRAA